jgi:hypothetical protein
MIKHIMDTKIEITGKNVKRLNSILTQIRKGEGVSQTTLAKKMKKPQPFICNVETQSKTPSTITMVKYLQSLGWNIVLVKKSSK